MIPVLEELYKKIGHTYSVSTSPGLSDYQALVHFQN